MYKTLLQELCHKNGWNLAEYVTTKEGQDHCPRFTTTCTVRGIPFKSPPNQCKSSKESQNLAAKEAYEHMSAVSSLTVAVPHSVTSPDPTNLPAPGFLFSGNKNVGGKTVVSEELVLKNLQNALALPSGGQTAPTNQNLPKGIGELLAKNCQTALSPGGQSATATQYSPKGIPHLYKNRLQHLTQKNNLSLPLYSSEFDGPPHAPRFRATVTVDGRPYKTVEFFSTLRDAEQAAAKIAIESLSNGAIQEDDTVYKSLLQEYSQRNNMSLPSYSTERIGPSHASTFKCTVEVGGRSFYGAVCKTKKLAEMNAAKVAYNDLTQCKVAHTLADGMASENTEIGSSSLHPLNTDSLQLTTAARNGLQTHMEVVGDEKGSSANGKMKAAGVSPKRVASNKNGEDVTGNEPGAKKPKNCTSPDDEHFYPEFTLINAVPHCSANDAGKVVGGGGDTRSSKIVIYSRESNMSIPQGASILPCSNDKWLVTSQLESSQNC